MSGNLIECAPSTHGYPLLIPSLFRFGVTRAAERLAFRGEERRLDRFRIGRGTILTYTLGLISAVYQ